MNSDYFKTRINEVKDKLNLLDENEVNDGVLVANIDSIRNSLFEILDHSINHFPNYDNSRSDIYFPIINLNENIEHLKTDFKFCAIQKYVGQKAENYILDAYKIIFNPKFDCCLTLLNSASKHRNLDRISKEKNEIKGEYYSFGGPQIEKDIYGNLNIPGFFHGMGNVHMSNVSIKTPNGVNVIISLNKVRVQGNSLVISKNGQEIEVSIKLFLNKCIECCEEIINLWNNL